PDDAAADGADDFAATRLPASGKRPNMEPAANESAGVTRRRVEGGDEATDDAAAHPTLA
ncbi:hypothetical protein HK405_009403, partial [Cladochytrium tenue]